MSAPTVKKQSTKQTLWRDAGLFLMALFVVFRFVINCCAADATPAAVLVDGEDMPDLPESAWVEVEGTFTLHEKNGRRVPILEKSSIKKIDAPKQQYLF